MKTIHFKSCKVAVSLPLDRIAAFLKTQMQFSWKEYIILKGSQLNFILQYNTEQKHVYLFKYGCISFVNFEDNEIHSFLQYMIGITGKINYELIYTYFETHTLEVDEDGFCELWKNGDKYPFNESLIHIISVVLAKSTELYKFETDLNLLLDNSEKFIYFIQKARSSFFIKKSSVLISTILRFEYDSIHSIRIFERPGFVNHYAEYKGIYDIFSKYYELNARHSILTGKTGDLRLIVKQYSKLSHKHTEYRLLIFEIFLLALFPIFHILKHIISGA
ncbi:MAG: RMD1 family protein [Clostridiaceae bacterium]|nr:RMD1 family protein [Clostridiaceae bacterium]